MKQLAGFGILAAAMLFGAAVLSGCTYGGGSDSEPTRPDPLPAAESTIDVDATLEDVEAGSGVGAFVEYQAGGRWHVFTSCDTDISGYGCYFDIILTPLTGTLTLDEEEDLEDDDYLSEYGSDSVRFVAFTTSNLDGAYLEADPGVPLEVDVWLDDAPAERFIYWVGDGGAHHGAPENPIDLVPSEP